jgi:hypothetical protein
MTASTRRRPGRPDCAALLRASLAFQCPTPEPLAPERVANAPVESNPYVGVVQASDAPTARPRLLVEPHR